MRLSGLGVGHEPQRRTKEMSDLECVIYFTHGAGSYKIRISHDSCSASAVPEATLADLVWTVVKDKNPEIIKGHHIQPNQKGEPKMTAQIHPDDLVKMLSKITEKNGYVIEGLTLVNARSPVGMSLPVHEYSSSISRVVGVDGVTSAV